MTVAPYARGSRTLLATATLAALLLLSGCWPDAAGPGPTTAATRSSTATRAPHRPPPPRQVRRSPAQLRAALLTLAEVPAGMTVLPGVQPAPGDSTAFAGPRSCGTLVRLLRSGRRAGSSATARITFTGGQNATLLDETLDAMGSSAATRRSVDTYAAAVRSCGRVRMQTAGPHRSVLDARAVSWPQAGGTSTAARFSGHGGPLEGFSALLVLVQTRDVVVGLTFLGMDDTAAAAGTVAAVSRVRAALASRPA